MLCIKNTDTSPRKTPDDVSDFLIVINASDVKS